MNDVPQITIDNGEARSNSATPRHIPDTCACWELKAVRQARKLLKTKDSVVCLDATAFAAMTSMAYDMLIHGRPVKAKVLKGWPMEGAA